MKTLLYILVCLSLAFSFSGINHININMDRYEQYLFSSHENKEECSDHKPFLAHPDHALEFIRQVPECIQKSNNLNFEFLKDFHETNYFRITLQPPDIQI